MCAPRRAKIVHGVQRHPLHLQLRCRNGKSTAVRVTTTCPASAVCPIVTAPSTPSISQQRSSGELCCAANVGTCDGRRTSDESETDLILLLQLTPPPAARQCVRLCTLSTPFQRRARRGSLVAFLAAVCCTWFSSGPPAHARVRALGTQHGCDTQTMAGTAGADAEPATYDTATDQIYLRGGGKRLYRY